MKNLNGWQRLWVVLSLILFIPVILIMFVSIPSKDSITSEWADELVEKSLELKEYSGVASYQIRLAYSDLSDDELIKRIMDKHAKKMDAAGVNYKEVNKKFEKELANLYISQIAVIARHIFSWAGLMGLVYLLGWSLGWIWRGFRSID